MIRWLLLLVCIGMSACASARVVDDRLTTAGRAATPLQGQAPSQHVDDMTECREHVMDRLLYAGAYALYNPLRFRGAENAIRDWQERFAVCLQSRGYGIAVPRPTSRSGR